MNAADVAEQVAAIKRRAKELGLRVAYVSVSVDSFSPHNVEGRVSVLDQNRDGIKVSADDFPDAIARLWSALEERAGATNRLSAVLGIPVEFAAAS